MTEVLSSTICSVALLYGAEVNPFTPPPPQPPDARTLGAGMGRRRARAEAAGAAVATVDAETLRQLTAACERPFAVEALPFRRPARSQAEHPKAEAQRSRNSPNKVRPRQRTPADSPPATSEAGATPSRPHVAASVSERRAERDHVERRKQSGAFGREPLPSATATVRPPAADMAADSACGPFSQEYGAFKLAAQLHSGVCVCHGRLQLGGRTHAPCDQDCCTSAQRTWSHGRAWALHGFGTVCSVIHCETMHRVVQACFSTVHPPRRGAATLTPPRASPRLACGSTPPQTALSRPQQSSARKPHRARGNRGRGSKSI